MKRIYIVCQKVDVGCNVRGAFDSQEKADEAKTKLLEAHQLKHKNCSTGEFFIENMELNRFYNYSYHAKEML